MHKATYEEETEYLTYPGPADIFGPQHLERSEEKRARPSKRVALTAADKKKVNKKSIGLPVDRTLKQFAGNCSPFLIDFYCIPVDEYRERYPDQLKIIDWKFGVGPIFEIPRSHLASFRAHQRRTSLSGTTLHSIAQQQSIQALPGLPPSTCEDLQNRQTSNNIASPVIVELGLSSIPPDCLKNLNTWVDRASIPAAADSEFHSGLVVNEDVWEFIDEDLVIDEDVWVLVERSARQRKSCRRQIEPKPVSHDDDHDDDHDDHDGHDGHDDDHHDDWDLIERIARQQKSHRRQLPDTMSTEMKDTPLRGSNSTRPSGSLLRPSESNARTTTNLIKDRPGTSARRPKNMPSGSQLPACWNDEMDELICHMEAQCQYSTRAIVRALKQRFGDLKDVSPPGLIIQILSVLAEY